MFRAPNPFDTRVGHAAQRLASGGANCSTCTTCSSCIVTAIAVGVISSRMVANAPPPPEAIPADAPTVPELRGLRMLVAALLPLTSLVITGFLAFLGLKDQGNLWIPALLLLAPLWLALRFATRHNTALSWKLALLILIPFPLLLAGEMFLWIKGIVH